MTPIRARQNAKNTVPHLSSNLRATPDWVMEMLDHVKPRDLSLLPPKVRPTLIYTDASEEKARKHRRFIVGGVLDAPHLEKLHYFSWVVPKKLVDKCVPGDTYITQLELFAAPVALAVWQLELSDADVIHFVHNDGPQGQ